MNTSLSSEQNSTLRTAVKAKLVEIGEYVDDQLTDYVMILATNKKNEKQMAEDLELFLGGIEQSTMFSAWLHVQLKNITSKDISSVNNQFNLSGKKMHQSSAPVNSESDEIALQVEGDEFSEDADNSVKNRTTVHSSDHRESETTRSRRSKSGSFSSSYAPTLITKSISSCIGAVIKNNRTEKDAGVEKEFDDSSRTRSRLSSSVVKISERCRSSNRKKSPSSSSRSSLQPNRSILLRAVDAANQSIKSSQENAAGNKYKSMADLKLEAIRSKRNETEKKSAHENEENSRPKRLKANSLTSEHLDKYDEQPGQIESSTEKSLSFSSENRRLVQVIEEVAEREAKIDPNEKPLKTLDTNKSSEPKFIITLTGLRDDVFLNKVAPSVFSNKRSFAEMNELDELDYDETYDDYDQTQEQIKSQNDIEMNEINDGDQMDINEDDMTTNDYTQEQRTLKKKLIRCTFWPACEKGDACLYLHPNKPCTTFPNCAFGQLCHYIHPNCRFDGFCTRPDCPFTHNVKKIATSIMPTPTATPASATVTKMEQSESKLSYVSIQNVPNITINKLQPFPGSQFSVNNTAESTTRSTFSTFKTTVPASAPSSRSLLPLQTAAYFGAGNQYKTVNKSTVSKQVTNVTLPNCKFGIMCKNPKCIYVHAHSTNIAIDSALPAPPTSQFKWISNNKSAIGIPAVQATETSNETGQNKLPINSPEISAGTK